MTDTAPQEGSRVSVIAEAILADAALMHPHPDVEETTGLAYEAAERIDVALRTSPEGPTRVDLAWAFSLLLDCLQKGKEPEDYEWDRINAIDDALTRDESSTEGGARPGDSPLNDTRTNSDRPWREDVARAFVTNRPAQPEGAGEARVKARKPDQDDLRMLRDMAEPNWATGLNPGQKAVIGRVLDALGVYEPAPSDTPTEEEGT